MRNRENNSVESENFLVSTNFQTGLWCISNFRSLWFCLLCRHAFFISLKLRKAVMRFSLVCNWELRAKSKINVHVRIEWEFSQGFLSPIMSRNCVWISTKNNLTLRKYLLHGELNYVTFLFDILLLTNNFSHIIFRYKKKKKFKEKKPYTYSLIA